MTDLEIFIEVEPWEERVAVREGGTLAEFFLERPEDLPRVGSVFAGRITALLPGVRAGLVDIGGSMPAFLPVREPDSAEFSLVRGANTLVQIVKRPLNGKRAQLTRMVSLPGRLLVLTPGMSGAKVSRRIEDAREKARLESVLAGMVPAGFSLLARTSAEGKGEAELRAETDRLVAEWRELEARAKSAPAPVCVREEVPLRVRALRDLLGAGSARVRVAPPQAAEELRAAVAARFPDFTGEIVPEEPGLFWRVGLETEVEQTLDRRVWLRGGGSLVIDTAEAMTVVDVNSGSPAEEGSPEEVALRTNLEAAQEVPRQLRLRGIGGIIMVDFIDMPGAEHWKQVIEMLESTLRRDRVKTQITPPSSFGVVEMTRKRVDETTHHHLTEACPACGGRGRTLSPESVAILVARKVQRALKSGGRLPVTVRVSPRLGGYLRDNSKILKGMPDLNGSLSIVDDPALACEDFKVNAS